jgi:hypothetical protein
MIVFVISIIPLIMAAQGDFECIDDTKFKLFTSETSFVVNSCPAGLCATRSPKFKNPCIGRDRAAVIDGVIPPNPGASSTATELPVNSLDQIDQVAGATQQGTIHL